MYFVSIDLTLANPLFKVMFYTWFVRAEFQVYGWRMHNKLLLITLTNIRHVFVHVPKLSILIEPWWNGNNFISSPALVSAIRNHFEIVCFLAYCSLTSSIVLYIFHLIPCTILMTNEYIAINSTVYSNT